MLRAVLRHRYTQSKRGARVAEVHPGGFESWLRIGVKEEAPAIVNELAAMLSQLLTEIGSPT